MSRKDKTITKQFIIDQMTDNEIDLSMNELISVPVKELALVPRGTRLDLSRNHLKSLPDNFGILRHLLWLDLSCNKLQSLPDSFGQLVLLQKLDLYSNQLTTLPLTFWNLRKLKWLDLKNNPLEPGLQEAAGTCVTSKECNHCATKVMAYIKLQLSRADRNKQNALEKLRLQEKIKREEDAEKRRAVKRDKDMRRRQKREEQVQRDGYDLEEEEEVRVDDETERACGRARIIEKKSSWSVVSVCSAVLLASVVVIVFLVMSIMLCNNFLDPAHCQSIRLGFIKTMANVLEFLGAKVD